MARRNKRSEVVLDPKPLQWVTPEIPRNFYVTGYSPFTMGLDSDMYSPETNCDTNRSAET